MMDDEYGDREEGRAVTRSEENRPVMSSEAGPAASVAPSRREVVGRVEVVGSPVMLCASRAMMSSCVMFAVTVVVVTVPF